MEDDKQMKIEELEESFATLKWEIWEQFPIEKRNKDMQLGKRSTKKVGCLFQTGCGI